MIADVRAGVDRELAWPHGLRDEARFSRFVRIEENWPADRAFVERAPDAHAEFGFLENPGVPVEAMHAVGQDVFAQQPAALQAPRRA